MPDGQLHGLDQVAGVSTSGPTIPYLWGRGTMLQSSPSGLIQGITVRATAIAAAADGIRFDGASGTYSAGPAKTAGQPYQYTNPSGNPVGLPGVAPFALSRAFWQSVVGQHARLPRSRPRAFSPAAGQAIQSSGILQIGQQIGGSS